MKILWDDYQWETVKNKIVFNAILCEDLMWSTHHVMCARAYIFELICEVARKIGSFLEAWLFVQVFSLWDKQAGLQD